MNAILESIQFGILSDVEILRQSVCEITNTKLTGVSSIYDERMGVLENGKLCVTCNKNNKECTGHFGHIRLNVNIAHPLFHKMILSVLRCICYKCSKVLMTKEQFEFHGLLKYNKQTRFTKVLKLLEKTDTCLDCYTLQPKYVFSTTEKTISMVFKIDGDIRKNILYDYEIRKIFENMSSNDVELLGFDPNYSHPKSLIINILPVLPPVARPYIISDNVTCDDDLTIQYLEIIKANTHLVTDTTLTNELKRQRYIQSLKFRIKCLFDNSQERSKHSNGRPLKGIKKRLTGKEGQLRNNLMGKRVDKSARTVIGPDPTLKVNEIAIPFEIADILTYPVRVTERNLNELTNMLYNHRINYVIRKDSGLRINMKYALFKQNTRLQFGDYILKNNGQYIFIKNEKQFFLLENGDRIIRNGKTLMEYEPPIPKHFKLEIGDTVERKIQDGDILLLNRQPTLHKGSMMAFNCKLRQGKTIRMNLAITKSFNADFDGDEMNLHGPNSVETEAELRLLSSVQNHIISNQSNKPNIVIVQDGLLSAYLLSNWDYPIPQHTFLNIIQLNEHWLSLLSHKQTLFQQKCPHLPTFSGKLLFSFLLPNNLFYNYKNEVIIEEGILVKGQITKTQLGSSHQSLIAKLYHDYSPYICEQFINDVQFLGNAFLLYRGFSVGIKDCLIPKESSEEIQHTIQKHFLQTSLYYDSIKTPHILEMSISNVLNNTRNSCMKIAKDNLSVDNNFLATVTSGSKGDFFNITQIMAMLGQQNFQGQRIQPSLSGNKRTLPHFPINENDYSPAMKFQSQGFIKNSFLQGLDPTEFWFHAITGREGITDTAMKSVSWDTPIFLKSTDTIIYTNIGKWIDSSLQNNSSFVQHDKKNGMESLDISSHKLYVPSMDDYGNVMWAHVSNITRHDPTKQMFRIRTMYGREVIVTDSKSLLRWDSHLKQFKEIFTTQLQIGDCLPVNHTHPIPIINNSRFYNTLCYKDGLYLGLRLAIGEKNLMYYPEPDIQSFVQSYMKNDLLDCFPHNTFSCNIFQTNKATQTHFLSGYCSTDKCHISPSGVRVFTSSKDILNGLILLFSNHQLFGSCKALIPNEYFELHFHSKFANRFKTLFKLIDTNKQKLLYETTFETNNHLPIQIRNDVILDPICSIENVNPQHYPKVYDITVPLTLNFGIANGLQVRDTATSGYIQRRMVKVAEDVQVKYDGTVRNSAGSILQFRYGNHNYDPSQSIILKDDETHKSEMFFADVSSIVNQLNHSKT